MANTKSLIIIQPVSGPLQKLHEVLISISAEENIEIISTSNMNEIGQLCSMGGQHLVLTSDPKLCAVFLQDNRAKNLSNHSKTLLFTGKPLPIKILDKFVKLGLTENLLDTAAPKTLLYKVKLLLKSLKPNNLSEDKVEKQDQQIKTMIDTNHLNDNEKSFINKAAAKEEVSSEGATSKKKKTDDVEVEGLDYLKDLKKKKNYQEDSIQTNWVSKKQKTDSTEALDSEEEKKKGQGYSEVIDSYLRNKKRLNEGIEFAQESDEENRKKSIVLDEDSASENKKRNFTEIELEDSQETKNKTNLLQDQNEDPRIKKEKSTEIELINSKEKKEVEFAPDAPKEKKKSNYQDELNMDPLKGKVDNSKLGLSQDGNMLGKVLNNTEIELEDSINTKPEDGLLGEEDPYARKKPLRSELEDADSNLRSKIEPLAEERERESQRKSQSETELDNHEEAALKPDIPVRDEAKKKKNSLELDLLSSTNDFEKTRNEDEEKESKGIQQETGSMIDTNDKLKTSKLEQEELERDRLQKKLTELGDEEGHSKRSGALEDIETDDHKKASATKEDKDKDLGNKGKLAALEDDDDNLYAKSTRDKNDEDKNNDRNNNRADKLDKYMRGGAAKKVDENWDHQRDKLDKLDLFDSKSQKDINVKKDDKKNLGEQTIDYRVLRQEFKELELLNQAGIDEKNNIKRNSEIEEEDSSTKVILLQTNGFDFAVNIINQYYNPEIKSVNIFKTVAEKLERDEKAYLVCFSYAVTGKQHKEIFNSFKDLDNSPKEYWTEFIQEQNNLEYIYSKTMSSWLCREIKEKEGFWSDTELPSWAPQELTNKVVEYIYPFYDGLDRMGVAYLYFPEGIKPQNEKKILVLIELLRGLFLENIQREIKTNDSNDERIATEQKSGNVLSMFGNLFGKKKTG